MRHNQNKFILLFLQLALLGGPALADTSAKAILSATGTKGGLIVHLGCGDGKLTAEFCLNDSYLVHGLDRNARNIQQARRYIHDKGLWGKVIVEHWSQDVLPYNDNIVNLLVAQDFGAVPMQELLRVLAPGAVAYISSPDRWVKIVKPRPPDIDEWTHFLHDADNNAVARDSRIATPNHLQWQAEPKRTRDHDAQASISAMTSSGGRIFYIIDEGPTSLIHRPPKWRLIARDAFNGKLLWKRPIKSWITHLHYFRSGPVQLPRRLVSIGQRVYVTLGFDDPVVALDAATGRTKLTFKGSEKAEEFISCNGLLLVVIGEPQAWNRHAPVIDNYWEFYDENGPQPQKSIAAYDVKTAKRLWQIEGDNLVRLVPLSLTAGGNKLFYLDNENLYCLDLRTAKKLWHAPFPTRGLFLRNYAPTVVHYKDTVLCLSLDRLAVFSVKDGNQLWQTKGYAGYASPGDLFVINDTVWTFPGTQAIRVNPQDVPGQGKKFLAFDLYTGRVKKSILKNQVWPGGHHHRCYRNKATERYLISSRRGLEFVDLQGNNNTINWWVRGICQYGFMPCNGLIYAPPHPCQCFVEIKLDGFYALAANAPAALRANVAPPTLTRGKAYGQAEPPGAPDVRQAVSTEPAGLAWAPPVPNEDPEEWPTYRHDISRSGCATTSVPPDLEKKWKADIGSRLTSIVVAAKKLFVAATDQQTLYCLNSETGQELWRFIATGRIDSPPTIHGQMVVFGCRDGRVYALRAADGELIWRFTPVPLDRRTVVKDRLESLWPIHGSVLIVNNTVYFAAGRSSYLDGGLRLYGLDAASGKVLCSARLHSEGTSRDGTMPDILVSDGQNIFMRQRCFDLDLHQAGRPKLSALTTRTGFIEDCWAHRLRWNWMIGPPDTFGKLLVFDGKMAYGVQSFYTFLKHDKSMQPSTHTGHLHQKYARYTPDQFPIGTRLFARPNKLDKTSPPYKKPTLTLSGNEHLWNCKTLMQFRAMVLAGNLLFAAGWKDSVKLSEKDPPARDESALAVISAADGRTLKQYRLKTEPVFDGMAAAYGRLYLALKNGSVLCFAGKQ